MSTSVIRIIFGVLTAICWIFSFILWRKKPGEFFIIGFICTVILATFAELLNNYLVRRKK